MAKDIKFYILNEQSERVYFSPEHVSFDSEHALLVMIAILYRNGKLSRDEVHELFCMSLEGVNVEVKE